MSIARCIRVGTDRLPRRRANGRTNPDACTDANASRGAHACAYARRSTTSGELAVHRVCRRLVLAHGDARGVQRSGAERTSSQGLLSQPSTV